MGNTGWHRVEQALGHGVVTWASMRGIYRMWVALQLQNYSNKLSCVTSIPDPTKE
jgi:hypothetical protein